VFSVDQHATLANLNFGSNSSSGRLDECDIEVIACH